MVVVQANHFEKAGVIETPVASLGVGVQVWPKGIFGQVLSCLNSAFLFLIVAAADHVEALDLSSSGTVSSDTLLCVPILREEPVP